MPENLSWEERKLAEGRWFRTRFGPLHLIIVNRGDEWRVASWRGEDQYPDLPDEGAEDALPEELEWIRYSCEVNDRVVTLQPRFPEFSIIAKPRDSFTLAPGSSALFFVGIPASIEVLAPCRGTMQTLALLPAQTLSKSWAGNRSVGSLCFALRTRARRSYVPDDWPEHDIVCAVDLKNQRSTSFPFQSLKLDTGHLAIFEKDGRLWSNASRVNISENEHDETTVTYAPRPLDPAEDGRELVPPALGRTRRSNLLSAFSSFTDVLR